jgi:hypothetical protein
MATRATVTLQAVLGVWLLQATAAAAIDCSNPDNLCTGDPCVIPALLIDSPCTADFGTRTVVIAGALDVQTTALELHAGAISVEAPLVALATDVSLFASGDIEVSARFDTSAANGSEYAGDIVLDAGGTVNVTGSIRASNVTIGSVPGPVITITAGNAIHIPGSVDGSAVTEAATLNMTAGGDITLDGPVRCVGVSGGFVTVDASGSVAVRGGINATGKTDYYSRAGRIVLRGATGVAVESPLTVTSNRRYGYDDPPMVDIASSAGDVIVTERINANATGPSQVLINAAGLVRLDAALRARSRKGGGLVQVTGATVEVTDQARVTALRNRSEFTANAGDLTLSGRFSPGVHSTIQGTASGNLVANGVFRAPDGCIGLSAGGTLDTSGGRFNPPIVTSCP